MMNEFGEEYTVAVNSNFMSERERGRGSESQPKKQVLFRGKNGSLKRNEGKTHAKTMEKKDRKKNETK